MRRRNDPNQILIDWTPSGGDAPKDSVSADPKSPPPPPATQSLPWDFQTTFPQPTDDATDAGILTDDDDSPEAIKAIHDEHAGELLSVLRAIDAVADVRRTGIDPKTGRRPRTHTAREKLRRDLEHEPARLERSFNILIETYAKAFGDEASEAFAQAIRARYAGIKIVVDNPAPVMPHRVTARFPVPEPLPAAVKKGVFGYDPETDEPIHPDPAEVRAITQNHAERLIDVLQQMQHRGADHVKLTDQLRASLALYAEDFGQEAANRLEAYARRQAEKDEARTR